MSAFRQKFASQMQIPENRFNDRFDIVEAKRLVDNLDKGIYADALGYLTGQGEDQRCLKMETLSQFNVGLGKEKFTDDDGVYKDYDSIYFPIYMPRAMSKEMHSRLDKRQSIKGMKKMLYLANAEAELETDLAFLAKMKIRAAYKPNKSKQRVLPRQSKLR